MEELTQREKTIIAIIRGRNLRLKRTWLIPLNVIIITSVAGLLIYDALINYQRNSNNITMALLVLAMIAQSMNSLNLQTIIQKLSETSQVKYEIAKIDLTPWLSTKAIFMIVVVIITAFAIFLIIR